MKSERELKLQNMSDSERDEKRNNRKFYMQKYRKNKREKKQTEAKMTELKKVIDKVEDHTFPPRNYADEFDTERVISVFNEKDRTINILNEKVFYWQRETENQVYNARYVERGLDEMNRKEQYLN